LTSLLVESQPTTEELARFGVSTRFRPVIHAARPVSAPANRHQTGHSQFIVVGAPSKVVSHHHVVGQGEMQGPWANRDAHPQLRPRCACLLQSAEWLLSDVPIHVQL
jgi:hypothetical protein